MKNGRKPTATKVRPHLIKKMRVCWKLALKASFIVLLSSGWGVLLKIQVSQLTSQPEEGGVMNEHAARATDKKSGSHRNKANQTRKPLRKARGFNWNSKVSGIWSSCTNSFYRIWRSVRSYCRTLASPNAVSVRSWKRVRNFVYFGLATVSVGWLAIFITVLTSEANERP